MAGRDSRQQAIGAWLRGHDGEIADFLAKLIAIPTENPPGNNYRQCADLLEQMARSAGLVCERFESPDGRGASHVGASSLLASYGAGDKILYFHGHYDVVPTQAPQQFEPRREQNFLFGRGSCDMKGGLVAMLFAIRALRECGAKLKGKVSLATVCDEETGGARGSAWLAQQGLLGRDGIGMLTAEPTSGVIWNANRGAITLHVEVLGKSAHVGLQHKGENAFERMHRVVARLLDLKSEVEARTTRHKTGADENNPPGQTRGKRGPRHSILLLGGESGGGTNFNVVPEKCWFTIDRRMNPEEDFDDEKARLISVLEQCKLDGIPLRWETLQEGRSASCLEEEPLGRALVHSVTGITGKAPRFEMCPGLLETRFYAECGMPAYAYGPGLLSVAHGPDEYIDLRKVTECAEIYALTAADLLGK